MAVLNDSVVGRCLGLFLFCLFVPLFFGVFFFLNKKDEQFQKLNWKDRTGNDGYF